MPGRAVLTAGTFHGQTYLNVPRKKSAETQAESLTGGESNRGEYL